MEDLEGFVAARFHSLISAGWKGSEAVPQGVC